MSTPLFFPPAVYVPKLFLKTPIPLRAVCELAGTKCRASGAWTERQIEILTGESIKILAEPGDWGSVRIEVPPSSPQSQARIALAALAYGMHDLVAKQSMANASWNSLKPQQGRPRSGCALSGAERQRRFRQSS